VNFLPGLTFQGYQDGIGVRWMQNRENCAVALRVVFALIVA
jgi:hypothetical protein